jgi:hypothetical protein
MRHFTFDLTLFGRDIYGQDYGHEDVSYSVKATDYKEACSILVKWARRQTINVSVPAVGSSRRPFFEPVKAGRIYISALYEHLDIAGLEAEGFLEQSITL